MELVFEEALSSVEVGQDVIWTATSFSTDESSFNTIVLKLLRLEGLGAISILEKKTESFTGNRYWSYVKFTKNA
jgi:hypothetical protein